MILANHGIVSSSGASFDVDALAFITAASITDNTQKTAVNTLVTDLKGYNIWTKMKAIYPFVGGSASSHKFNLKDPRDLDAAFRLVFNGGWTHTSTGALPNGTNGYADTLLNLKTQTTLFNVHYSIYNRNNFNGGGDMGVANSNDDYKDEGWMASRANDFAYGGFYDNDGGIYGGSIKVVNTDSTGMYISSAVAMNNQFLRKNNTTLGTWTNTGVTSTPANTTVYIGAVHLENNNSAILFTTRQYALASIGDGLTDSEAVNFYTAVQAYQTTLNRQV